MNNREKLIEIRNKYPRVYKKYIQNHYPELFDWINNSNEKLNDPVYTFKTKVSWIINNIQDFPCCIVCGKSLKGKNISDVNSGYPSTCSVKCSSNNPDVINKIKETNIKKYGVENFTQTTDFKEKSKQTCLEKYGVEFSFQSENNKIKSKQTCLEKYGVEKYTQSKDFKEKSKQTCLEKYGTENPFQNTDIKHKIKQTMLRKYGADHPMHVKEIKENIVSKSKSTNLLISWNKNILGDEYSSPLFDQEYWLKNYSRDFKFSFKCKKCGNIFQSTHFDGVHDRCNKCYPKTSSIEEKELLDFIKTIYDGDIIENSSSIINPYEIDIYLPEKNIAIEFDGLYWHSSQMLGLKGHNKYYHLNKTKLCREKGIRLIHIFEDEWRINTAIVKSRLKSIICGNSNRIFARQCIIKEVPIKDSIGFQTYNHIQGRTKAKIHLGLYYKEELVALMTFGSLRISLGMNSKENSWELVRFCSKLDTIVIGGASKLLSYFEKKYNPKLLISYADYRWSIGNLYYNLGFMFDHFSDPSYWYIKRSSSIRLHRFNYRKSVLKNKLKLFNETLSEKENMIANGYYTIYDCGNMVFKKEY